RRDVFHQRVVPWPVVADEHQLVGLRLRQSDAGQSKCGCRSLQQMTAFHPRPTPARRRLRCQSAANSSSATFAVFWPACTWAMAEGICTSSVSHTGWPGVGTPVSSACAPTGGQPIRSTISASFSTERSGGALPRIIAFFCQSCEQHMAINSSAHSLFFVYFG